MKRLVVFLTAGVLALISVAGTSTAGATSPPATLSRTPLVTLLPVTHTGYIFTTVVSVDIDVVAGEVWTFDAAAESTTPYNANIFVARYLKVSDDLTGYDTSQSEGDLLARPMGRNTNADIHHDTVDVSRTWVASETGTKRVELILYAASTAAPEWTATDGWNLAVSYVELSATRVSTGT